jgi:hypothetical protein
MIEIRAMEMGYHRPNAEHFRAESATILRPMDSCIAVAISIVTYGQSH